MRYLPFILACSILVSTCPAQTHHKKHKRSNKSKGQLQGQLATVRKKKNQLRAEIHETKKKVRAVSTDLHAVDQKLTSVQHRLEDTTEKLSSGKERQKTLAAELTTATKKLDDTRKQVRARLKRLYMKGQGNYISALVGTQSVGELASRKVLMEAITRKDRQLFTEFQNLEKQVRQKKAEQDHLVRRVAELASSQRAQENDLKEVRQEKGEVLENLRDKQGQLQKMLNQFEEDERDIAAQIAAFTRSRPGGKYVPQMFSGRFSKPVNAPITSGFGMRYHPILHKSRIHAGIDFGAHYGASVHAAAEGVVISTSYMRGFGNVVIIDHGGGIQTVYAHLSSFGCSGGQRVARGQRIGAVGNTGLATGPHLHFEVHVHGHAVNPLGKL